LEALPCLVEVARLVGVPAAVLVGEGGDSCPALTLGLVRAGHELLCGCRMRTAVLQDGGMQHAGAQHVLAGSRHARLADGLLGEFEGLIEAFQHLEEPHPLQQDGKTALVLDLGQTHRALALVDPLAKGVGIVTLDQIHDCWLLSATVPLSLQRRSGNRPRHARVSTKPGRDGGPWPGAFSIRVPAARMQNAGSTASGAAFSIRVRVARMRNVGSTASGATFSNRPADADADAAPTPRRRRRPADADAIGTPGFASAPAQRRNSPESGFGDATASASVTSAAPCAKAATSAPWAIFAGCGPAASRRGSQSVGKPVADAASTRFPNRRP